MSKFISITGAAVFLMLVSVVVAPAVEPPIAPDLGAADAFSMLGGTISNTGTSLVTGNVGATTTITGFPPGTATGTVYTAPNGPSSTVGEAYSAFVAAYDYAAGETPTQSINGLTESQTFLGNIVYSSAPLTNVTSTAGITLTFNAQNNSSDVFLMQIPGALTINGPITFDLTNGALASNIYWIVGAATTIDPTNVPLIFDGNILGQTSSTISAQTGGSGVLAATINGCVFAETANTLAGQTDVNGCTVASLTPEPGSAGLAALGCLLGALWVRRRRLNKPWR
jgi:Ice-binding-like